MEELQALMHRMWAQGQKYHKLTERAERRLKKFGIKRFIFLRRFHSIRKKIYYYKQVRFNYVAMALGISRKINARRRAERAKRQRFDH